MSGDDEIVLYLESLLEHQAECQSEQCSSCLIFRRILESIRYRIFSGAFFPEVMIATRDAAPSDGPIESEVEPRPFVPNPRKVRQRTVPHE